MHTCNDSSPIGSCRYSEALQTKPSSDGLHKLYSNRCLAYSKAQRYQEGIVDAQKCIALAPLWAKGHWRLGMALLGVKQNLKAIQAFADCWRLDHGTYLPLAAHGCSAHVRHRVIAVGGILADAC